MPSGPIRGLMPLSRSRALLGETIVDEKAPDEAGYAAPPAPAPAPGQPRKSVVTPPNERVWYLRPKVAAFLGPLLIVVCLLLRFAWGGLEGPPFPFWTLSYVAGAAGIFLTYTAWFDRSRT
jgi:hypothetical protein